MELSPRQRALLDFEQGWWRFDGPKEAAIRDVLHLSATRYYRLLGELIDQPAALTYDPLTVKRLRRSRALRRRARYEGRQATPSHGRERSFRSTKKDPVPPAERTTQR